MKSARMRIAANFIFIIIITVIILEALIIGIIKQNYYKNLENSLLNQVKISADIYRRYFSDASLNDNVLNNVDTFWKQATAQVEIIDTDGRVLMDSIGMMPPESARMDDVREALKGGTGKWIGKAYYSRENVISVSYPLKSKDNNIVGALRFISSLKEVDKDVGQVAGGFLLIGIAVVLVSGIISLLLADTIVGPLEKITVAAEKMVDGDFHARCEKKFDDEVGKLSDTLNYLAEEILKKDQLKNDFISSVSHELRTPLTSIKGWAVTLKTMEYADGNKVDCDLDDGSNGSNRNSDREIFIDGLEIIEKESDRLTSMVEELLDFSRFVSGKVTIKKEEVIVENIMHHIERQLMPRAKRENIQLSIDFEDEMPDIITDENRLKQVFINILDNSFKFTTSGGEISFTANILEGDRIRFSIKDTGCGIPSEDLPKVKEKFYKGKNSKSKNGIGLSICDEIIKLMNGTFEIKSEIGKGTEAIVILPVKS
ncbi:MAG TPA: ATP-binding protein [Clostridiales bacterium]|nr:ATP-binding protein [Clostridiales bacterium]